jgi:hypothetical protein
MSAAPLVLHCWADGPDICTAHGVQAQPDTYECPQGCDMWIDGGYVSTTCMLEVDEHGKHTGEHVWTRDDQIGVSFAGHPEVS